MSSGTPHDEAKVVVIGGGVVGCATAYHLGKMGCTDALLLERAALGSGTTWHAAGNMETYREDPLLGEMIAYAVELYPKLEQETGQALGWRRSGRVTFTTDARRFAQYRGLPSVGEARGIEIELLTPEGVGEKLPIVNIEGLAGGIWVPSDGRVNPTDLAVALAKGARQQGVRVSEHTPVEAILTHNDRVVGVRTNHGVVRCESLVIAAGLWSAELGRSCGVALPLQAVEHFYFLTEALAEIDRDMPLFLSYDELMYGREDVGGLLFGFLDRDAVPVSPRDLPADFSFGLLPENWSQAEPYLEPAINRFPLLNDAGIRSLVNGPESFTPDGNMLLGPVPGVSGLYVAAAMNSNGIALSAAAGKLTAQWVLEGRPSIDASRLEVSRFASVQGSGPYLRERIAEVPSHFGLWPVPGLDYSTSRGVRRSPLHDWHIRHQAVFVSHCAWEHVEWYASRGECVDTCVDQELVAADDGAFVDMSSDAKIVIEGPGLRDYWQRIAPAVVLPSCGGVAFAPLLNQFSGIEADPLAVRLSSDSLLLIACAELEVRLVDWLKRHQCDGGRVQIANATSDWSRFELIGKSVSAWLDRQVPLGEPDYRARVVDLEIGCSVGHFIYDTRIEAWSVLVKMEFARQFIESLLALAPPMQPMGHAARERWRIAAGVPRWGRDVTPDMTLEGVGPVSPAYRNLAPATGSPQRTLGRLSLKGGRQPQALSPIWQDTEAVGHVTSSARLATGDVVAMGVVANPSASGPLWVNVEGNWLQIEWVA